MFCVPKVSSRTVGVVSCVRMMRLDGRSLIGVGVCIPRVAPSIFFACFSVLFGSGTALQQNAQSKQPSQKKPKYVE